MEVNREELIRDVSAVEALRAKGERVICIRPCAGELKKDVSYTKNPLGEITS